MLRRLGGSMPFPPPPAPAPGVPAARPLPRRPGALRKAAAPARAPPAPAPAPPAAGEKQRPPAPPSRSWPSATLRRPPARRAPGPAPAHAPAPSGPGRSPVRTAGPVGPAAAAARFSLRLTPEAALLVRRRHLEGQLLPPPRRPPLSPSADARARAAGLRRGGDPGGLGARRPAAPPLPRGPQAPHPRPDLRRVLQVSLLNDRHRYDDVEYEEEEAAGAPDEGLVRRCTEWLRGVESAAAARDRTGPLDALPHLSAL